MTSERWSETDTSRRVHIPKIAGSTPATATKKERGTNWHRYNGTSKQGRWNH